MDELSAFSELELVDAFLRLRNIDMAGKSFEEVLHIYFDHIPLLPLLVIPCHSTTPEMLFRAIKYQEPPTHVSHMSYPPKSITTEGRLNIEGHPVLYTSDKPLISIMEIGACEGETVYVGNWRAKDFNNIHIWPLLIDYAGNTPVHLKTKNHMLKGIQKIEPAFRSRYLIILRQMIDLLLGNTDRITSVIGHHMFNFADPFRVDICIYPSIQGRRQHVNFAVGLNMVESHLKLTGATAIKVEEMNVIEGYGRFRILRHAKVNGNELQWEEADPKLVTLGVTTKIQKEKT